MRITEYLGRFIVVLAGACLLGACGSSNPPSAQVSQPATPAAAPAPAPAPPASPTGKPFNVASIFPPGPGRDMVLSTCGSCHPVSCVARGQRTAERWASLQRSHKDKLTATSEADLNTMFSYLKANFSDTRPEPQIPPEALQQGCTPF